MVKQFLLLKYKLVQLAHIEIRGVSQWVTGNKKVRKWQEKSEILKSPILLCTQRYKKSLKLRKKNNLNSDFNLNSHRPVKFKCLKKQKSYKMLPCNILTAWRSKPYPTLTAFPRLLYSRMLQLLPKQLCHIHSLSRIKFNLYMLHMGMLCQSWFVVFLNNLL